MKRILVYLMLVAFSVTSYAKISPIMPMKPTKSIKPKDGNEGSGGGNGFPAAPPLNQNEIEYFLKSPEFRWKAEVILYRLSGIYDQDFYDCPADQCDPEQTLLLHGLKKIHDYGDIKLGELAINVEVQIQSNGPCYDNSVTPPAERDASADLENNSICISASRLLEKKYTKDTAPKNILSLFIHEISHILGTDESEAVKIQEYAFDNYDIPEYASKAKTDTITFLLVLQHDLKKMQSINPMSTLEQCLFLGMFSDRMENIYEIIFPMGYQIRPTKDLKDAMSLVYADFSNSGYCLQTKRQEYDAAFEEENNGVLDDFYYDGTLVRYINPGDYNKLKLNYSDMEKYISNVLVEIRKSNLPGDCKIVSQGDKFLNIECINY